MKIKLLKNYLILTFFIVAVVNLYSCPEEKPTDTPCVEIFNLLQSLRIDSIETPSPMLLGSEVKITGEGFLDEPQCVQPYFNLNGTINGNNIETVLTIESSNINEATFFIDKDLYNLLGTSGSFTGNIQIVYESVIDARIFTAVKDFNFELTDHLTPTVTSIPSGDVYLNDTILVEGSNFIFGQEGKSVFTVTGDFTPLNTQEGEAFHVENVELEGIHDQGESRTVTGFLFSPELSHLKLGTFTGTVSMCNLHEDNERLCSSDVLNVSWNVQESYVDLFDPETFSLGQIVPIRGQGFVGEQEGASTVITFKGSFKDPDGMDIPLPEEGVGIIPVYEDNTTLLFTVTIGISGSDIYATDFGEDLLIKRGTFDGEVYLSLYYGDYQRDIGPFDIPFTLGPVKQVYYVRFNDDFGEALELFGLRALEEEIKEIAIDKMRRVYANYNVEFRTEMPEDFYDGGFGIVEIYGRDPNGTGLFGYDNSPGKDINNLRLHDRIGGLNARTQQDGHAGYGGVFIDSFLFFSEHPDLDYTVEQPPTPVEEFDIIFDPVRDNKVIAGEYPNGATGTRLQQIETALNSLGKLIGDTVSHEIGHSLGLANPNMPEGGYHRSIPQDNCLMDAGGARPLGERIEANGNTGGAFCGEELDYMNRILPLN